MAEVTLSGVSKSFGTVEVLNGIDLRIADGAFCVFVGPSGCGKSTLLRMIAGLEEVSSGTISIGGRSVIGLTPKERGIAMVFQSYALYPHRTVRGNMAFGLRLSRLPRAEIDRRIARAAAMLKIEDLLDRRPAQLSGGQRQRVAIGRAIVREPTVFLFDEPLSNLDAALRVSTRREIAQLHRELDATMIYVTHDQVEAMTLADTIVVLHEGCVQQVGDPLSLYNAPVNLFVAQFIGSPRMNMFDARVIASDRDGAVLESPQLGRLETDRLGGAVAPGDALHVGLRPEHLRPCTAAGRMSGRVTTVEHLGDETLVEVTLAGGVVATAKGDGEFATAVAETAALDFDVGRLHFFAASGEALRPA